MDTENQAGTKSLRLAAGKGLAVVIMKPLLGGGLAKPPPSIRKVIEDAEHKALPGGLGAAMALEPARGFGGVERNDNLNQVNANFDSAARARSHSFGAADLKVIAGLRQKYRERAAIPSPSAASCMPCPNGVNIPAIFDTYNDTFLHRDISGSRFKYQIFIPEAARASARSPATNARTIVRRKSR